MRNFRLPGLSEGQSRVLREALDERMQEPPGLRERYPVPAPLKQSLTGQFWWLIFKELHDRPLATLLGIAASLTYPLVWWVRH